VTPEGKREEVRRARERFGPVLVVGDGVNDAPALAEADVGIAMGRGTGLAIHSAGATLMTEDLLRIPAFLALSRATMRVIRQNCSGPSRTTWWRYRWRLRGNSTRSSPRPSWPEAPPRGGELAAPPERRQVDVWTTLLLIAVSLALGFAAWLLFLWAVKSDQYDDVERPKHRMLDDDDEVRDTDGKSARGKERRMKAAPRINAT